MIPDIRISEYDYGLLDERIAKFPLEKRDISKLLLYDNGRISEDVFYNLPDYLEAGETMVFNDTKVVPARLFFTRPTGAHIEVFCLEPDCPKDYNLSFASRDSCDWNCIVGKRSTRQVDASQFCCKSLFSLLCIGYCWPR